MEYLAFGEKKPSSDGDEWWPNSGKQSKIMETFFDQYCCNIL